MIRILVRGLPNFSVLVPMDFDSVQSVFEAFKIRGRFSCLGDLETHFLQSSGNRVILYIQRSTDNSELLRTFCTDAKEKFILCLDASETPEGGFRPRTFGTGTARIGGWQSLSTLRHPDYNSVVADLRERARLERLRGQRLEEELASQQEELQSLLEIALHRHGHDFVSSVLKNLSVQPVTNQPFSKS